MCRSETTRSPCHWQLQLHAHVPRRLDGDSMHTETHKRSHAGTHTHIHILEYSCTLTTHLTQRAWARPYRVAVSITTLTSQPAARALSAQCSSVLNRLPSDTTASELSLALAA
jgi:hypothetical protein